MGTPARLPRAQRRAQLLETAVRQFTRSGYHRTSMDSIASAAGVTKPVLYQHFGSKEDLYLEVVRSVGTRLVTEISEIEELEGGARARIIHGLHSFTEILDDAGTTLHMLESSDVVSDEVALAVAEIIGHASASITRTLLRYREISPTDARILGEGISALARASASSLSSAATAEERERIADLLTRFIDDGLQSFPPRAVPRRPTGAAVAPTDDGPAADAAARPGLIA